MGIVWTNIVWKHPEIAMTVMTMMTIGNVSLETDEEADITTYDSMDLCLLFPVI